MQAKPITDAVTIGDQPSASDLESLPGQGYVGVVNLRNDGEPEQPLSTAAEGELVRNLGMDYLHYGVGAPPLTEAGVSAVCDFLDRHAPGKVLVHCRKGSRAAALVLIHRALAEGWKAGEAAARGREAGLAVDGNLKVMVEQYLANHSS